MKVSLAQFNPVLGDKEINLHKIKQLLTEASQENADIVVFPELCLTGYFIQDVKDYKQLAEPIEGRSVQQVQQLCKELGLFTVFTWPEQGYKGVIYNSACLISDKGEIVGTYRKVHLYDEEKTVFTPGEEFNVYDTSFGRIGLMICYDLDFPESTRILKLKKADIVFSPTNNMKPYNHYQETYLTSRSMENEIPLALCNRIGEERNLTFFGESAIYNSYGKNLLKLGANEELKSVEFQLNEESDPNLQYVQNRKIRCYSALN